MHAPAKIFVLALAVALYAEANLGGSFTSILGSTFDFSCPIAKKIKCHGLDLCADLDGFLGTKREDPKDFELAKRSSTLVPSCAFVVSSAAKSSSDGIYNVVANFEANSALDLNTYLKPNCHSVKVVGTGVQDVELWNTGSTSISSVTKFSVSIGVKAEVILGKCCLPQGFGIDFGLYAGNSFYLSLNEVYGSGPQYRVGQSSGPLKSYDPLSIFSDNINLWSKRGDLETRSQCGSLDWFQSIATSNNHILQSCWDCDCSPPPSSSTKPCPPTSSTKPCPPTSSTTPCPPTSSTTPCPPTSSTTPCPPTSSTTPCPPTSSTTPCPPTSSTTPCPPTSSTTPCPPTSSTTPCPPTSSTTPCPPTSSTTPCPPTSSTTPCPPTSSTTPCPPTSSTTPCPPTSSTTPCPPTSSTTPCPPTSSTTPCPPTSSTTPCPPTSSTTPCPPTSSTTPCPPTSSTTPCPPTTVTETHTVATTTITVTSCSDEVCTHIAVTTGVVVITEDTTVYTTFCPVTSSVVIITKTIETVAPVTSTPEIVPVTSTTPEIVPVTYTTPEIAPVTYTAPEIEESTTAITIIGSLTTTIVVPVTTATLAPIPSATYYTNATVTTPIAYSSAVSVVTTALGAATTMKLSIGTLLAGLLAILC